MWPSLLVFAGRGSHLWACARTQHCRRAKLEMLVALQGPARDRSRLYESDVASDAANKDAATFAATGIQSGLKIKVMACMQPLQIQTPQMHHITVLFAMCHAAASAEDKGLSSQTHDMRLISNVQEWQASCAEAPCKAVEEASSQQRLPCSLAAYKL